MKKGELKEIIVLSVVLVVLVALILIGSYKPEKKELRSKMTSDVALSFNRKDIMTYDELNDYIDEKISEFDDLFDGEIINTLYEYKSQLTKESLSSNIQEIYQEINTYLENLPEEDPSVLLVSLEGKSEIEVLLDTQVLNPMKTGYDELDDKVRDIILENTNELMTTSEKVKALYDFVIKYMSYYQRYSNYEIINQIKMETGVTDFDAREMYLALTAINNRSGNCEHYSALYMVLLRRLGLDSYVVGAITRSRVLHTSVNINLNGTFYTFDPEGDDRSLVNGSIRYYFYGKTDAEIARIQTYPNKPGSIANFNYFKDTRIPE